MDYSHEMSFPPVNDSSIMEGGPYMEHDYNYTLYEYRNVTRGYVEMPAYSTALKCYVTPVTIVVGIVANVLMFVLINNSKLRKLAPMVYVAGVTLTDSGYLLFNVFSWIEFYFQLNVYHAVGMCQLINYSIKSFTFLSRWYIASFAIERFIWEFLPERRAELCNAFRSKLVLISVAVVAIYGHVYMCWFLEVSDYTHNMCTVPMDNLQTFKTLLRIDMVFACMLPYGLAIVLSVFIACSKIRCKRRRTAVENRPTRTVCPRGRPQIVDNREDRVRHLHATGILLCYTLSLILLTIIVTIRDFFGVMFSTFVIPHSWAGVLGALLDVHFAAKPFICLLVSPKVRHCAKRLARRALCRTSNNKITRPNTNSINLQEFNIEESSDGTLIAVV